MVNETVRKLWYWVENRKADKYFALYRYDHSYAVRKLKRYLLHNCDLPVLDVGCGRGRWCAMLSQLGKQPIGVDITAHPSWHELRNPFLLADAQALPFKDNAFSTVISMLVLGYVPNDLKALREMKRVLKPSGQLVIQVTNRTNLRTAVTGKQLDQQNLREYFLAEIAGLLRMAGFVVAQIRIDRFYLPTRGRILYSILPDRFFDLAGKLIPARYRGVISIVALNS